MFPDKLQLEHVSGKDWKLLKPFRYVWVRNGAIITVPKGYITDQASVPSVILPMIVDNTGDISKAAVPHDYGYTHLRDSWKKSTVDLMFRDAMIESGVPKWRAYVAWMGVRANLKRAMNW